MSDPTAARQPSRPETGAVHHPRPSTGHRFRGRRWVAVALVGAALGLAACSSGGSSSTPTTMSMGGSASSGGSPSSAGGTSITIKNFAFAPMDLTVSPGATVSVTNKDGVAHTVTGKSGTFNTGDVAPGKTVTFTAPMKAGSYPYYCDIHQYMTGTLTVS